MTSRFARSTGGADATELVQLAVARAKDGDSTALHFLYVRYADDVRGYVRSVVRDPEEAEDLTQSVFEKLLGAIGRYEQREVPFESWLLRVARNLALDHLRRSRQVPVENVRAGDEGGEQLQRHRSWCLRDALDRLPPEQREVLVLRHVVGLSPPEIARCLGRTEASVHGLHHRGRWALRQALREVGAAPVTRGPSTAIAEA
jgi:RNA polymerase sigma-70 factor, ECF subfamily